MRHRFSFFHPVKIYFACCLLFLLFSVRVVAEQIRPDLDYFPSHLHAAIFRNWDIVPHERLAKVLGTKVSTIEKAGKELGLAKTEPLTQEEIRRNVEII